MENILIVDDSVLQGTALKNILAQDYHVEVCLSGEDAIGKAAAIKPSLILLDVILSGMDGFETLLRLKEQELTKNIPVILITSLTDIGNEEKGLNLGAVDYIVKPFNAGIVRARVQTHMQLYTYRRAFETLAMIDGMTGIYNRRYYDERSRSEWGRAMKEQRPLSIGLLDVDYFKQYNDIYGHPCGDDILKKLANELTGRLRCNSDFAARYGGEEFVFLMSDTSEEQGRRIACDICQEIEKLKIPHKGSPNGVLTVSIGGVSVTPHISQEYVEIFRTVDDMLYRAKKSGRNTVIWSCQTLSENSVKK